MVYVLQIRQIFYYLLPGRARTLHQSYLGKSGSLEPTTPLHTVSFGRLGSGQVRVAFGSLAVLKPSRALMGVTMSFFSFFRGSPEEGHALSYMYVPSFST